MILSEEAFIANCFRGLG